MVSPQITFDTAARQGIPRTLANASVLVDECVSPKCVPAIADIFGVVDSVQSLGLSGTKDRDLWQISKDRRYDIIITKDNARRGCQDINVCAKREVQTILRQAVSDSFVDIAPTEAAYMHAIGKMENALLSDRGLGHQLRLLPYMLCVPSKQGDEAGWIAGLLHQNQMLLEPIFTIRHSYGGRIVGTQFQEMHPHFKKELQGVINEVINPQGYQYVGGALRSYDVPIYGDHTQRTAPSTQFLPY